MSPRLHHPRGFTLVECVMAMAISAIILGVLTSLILVAGKTLPSRSMAGSLVRSANALDQLADDLRLATSVITLNANSLELSLPDLDGDGDADQVRYSWSGTDGAPLTREYTGSDAAPYDVPSVVVPAVSSLSFTPEVRTSITTTGGDTIAGSATSAETQLDAYDPTTRLSSIAVRSNVAVGQVFDPVTPQATTSFRVSRIQLRLAQRSPVDGRFVVALRNASGNVPGSTVLAQQVIDETSLSSSTAWVNITFPDCPDLDPTQNYAITVTWQAGSRACNVQFQSSSANTSTFRLARSTNNGSSWTIPNTTHALRFRVFGVANVNTGSSTITTPVVTTTSRIVEGFTVRFTPSGPGAATYSNYVQTLNLPDAP